MDDVRSLVKALRDNRQLASDEEVAAYTDALAKLRSRMDGLSVDLLFEGFDDASDQPQLTFQLVHLLESVPAPRLNEALLRMLPIIAPQASWWTEVLVARTLNSDGARQELHLFLEARDRGEREPLCRVLRALSTDQNESLASHARAMLRLC